MNEELYLTSEGAAKLKVELETLKGSEREAIAKRLRSAIQMGDLSENADYHKAKEDQAFLEGHIQELEYLLKYAKIIEENKGQRDQVKIGATITIKEGDYPEETFMLVGAKEADPVNGRISNESPIGSGLIGKKVNDIVTVETPDGPIRIKILKIE